MLNSRQCETLGPGRHSDSNGLYLLVKDSGARSWVARLTISGRRVDLGLGPFPAVGLKDARLKMAEIRAAVARGEDPRREKARVKTFREVADDYLAHQLDGLRNDKHKAQWRTTLETYAFPVLGDMPVDQIEAADIEKALRPIWASKPETASRVRGRIEAVLSRAIVLKLRPPPNPAIWRGNLELLMPRKRKRVQHHAAVQQSDLQRFWQALLAVPGTSARCLRFAVLTASRSAEARLARHEEIDGDLWTIPADRMKAGKAHVVPLPPAALAEIGTGTGLIFPTGKDTPLSDMALSMVIRRMDARDVKAGGPGFRDRGEVATPHGTARSSFRDWCALTGIDDLVAELCLAHEVGSAVERAYRRTDLIDRRREALAKWAELLNGTKIAP